jgi:uncharacterized protein (UPF0332 family)
MPDNVTATSARVLVYLSRISGKEKQSLYDLADACIVPGLREQFHARIDDVVIDRLMLAQEYLNFAERLKERCGNDTVSLRCVVNRAYYSIHHSIRAMLLKHNHCEADGHAEAIEQLKRLFEAAERKVSRAGLQQDIIEEVGEARNNRAVADYSPYEFSRAAGKLEWVPIRGNNWSEAAVFNLDVAKRIHEAALRFVTL